MGAGGGTEEERSDCLSAPGSHPESDLRAAAGGSPPSRRKDPLIVNAGAEACAQTRQNG